MWALWNSNSNKSSQRGVIAAKVYPTPVTNQQQAPSSLTKGNFDPEVVQPVPAASRRGGGVWTAYKVGYPTANRIRLWKVGTKQGFFIKAPDASMVTLAPGLNGRMWVAWWQNSKSRVHVARTNPAVTRIGPVRSIKPPTKKGLSTSIYSMAAVGMGGGLHLAINAAPGFGSSQIWYQKIAPALLVSATPARINAGKVTVRVSDAGQPIAGARVRFLGAAKLTNKKGVAVFRVKPSVHGGNYLVTGAKNGYAKGSDRVRVT